jgi:hypothetical protein
MRLAIYSSAALLTFALFLTSLRGVRADTSPRSHAENTAHPPELEYLQAVNSVAPPKDPQLLFLLMAQYSNLNLQGEGVEFFSARFKEFEPRLTDPQKSLYLIAIALLRAQNASSVSLLHRIGYMNDTTAMLDRAKRISGGKVFVVNWIAGVVRSELPGFFRQSKQPRPISPGAWLMPPQRHTQAGCEKLTITSESWPSRGENARRRRSIYKKAATKIGTAVSR